MDISNPTSLEPAGFTGMAAPRNKTKKLWLLLAGLVLLAGAGLLVFTFIPKKKILKTKTTLTYWGLFEPESVMQPVIAEFEKEHPKIKIQYQNSSFKEYRERLQKAVSAGEGPDIFRIHQSWVPMFGPYLSSVPSSVYDPAAFGSTFYPSAKESLLYQGQYVAIPLMYDGLALFYNEDLFKAAGKLPPKTWDELRKVAIELTVRDQQGKIRTSGVAMGAPNADHWSDVLGMMMLQNGADLGNPSACVESGGGAGKICPGADALAYFTLFTRVDRVWDITQPSSTFAFATGSLAMYFGPSWRVFDIESLKNQYQSKVNYKIIPVPQLPGGNNLSWSSYWVEAVAKNSNKQDKAWEFLKFLSSKETLQKLYQAESALRVFGELYPRVDMADLLTTQPVVGAFIQQAPYAKNWYLSSSTQDRGINDQIIKYYEDAVNAVNNGGDPVSALTTATQGIGQVLSQYGTR